MTTSAENLPRLFLIRYGDTDWTDSRKHTGRTDIPLNAHGEEHARLLGERLKGESFARVFVSPWALLLLARNQAVKSRTQVEM